MEKNITEFELKVDKNAEAHWEDFERTGSIQAYLQFAQESVKNEASESDFLPY